MIPFVSADQVSAFADLGTAVAAGFAAWQGVRGLSRWQKEKISGRKIELAEEALIHLYELQNAISAIRSPFGYANETADRELEQHESAAQKRNRESAYRCYKRISKNYEIIDKYRLTSIKVKALLGAEVFKFYNIPLDCLHEIQVSMSMLMETPYEGYNDGDLQKSFEAAIWYRGERAAADPKSIETRLKVSQDELEKILGKILDRY